MGPADAHAPRLPHRGGGATRRLGVVLALTAAFAVAEAAGGWLSNSLALLADAGHMLTDILALSLALLAAWSAQRPPDATRTYGYRRVEILAALFNGCALIVIALFIFIEAWERVGDPPQVRVGLMAAIAAGGLLVNLIAARVLHGHHQRGMNLRAAYLHILGDLLGSLGALVAAGLIYLLGWRLADPLVSAVIGVIIVVSAVRLVFDAGHVLLEGAPAHLNARAIETSLAAVDGVEGVHDLHVWSLEGEAPLLSAHLVLDHTIAAAQVLRAAGEMLRERYGVRHSTLQLEPADFNIVGPLSSASPRDAERASTP